MCDAGPALTLHPEGCSTTGSGATIPTANWIIVRDKRE